MMPATSSRTQWRSGVLEMAKKKFKALNGIDRIGDKVIEAGQEVSLEDEVAQPFVDGGSLVPVSQEAPESDGK